MESSVQSLSRGAAAGRDAERCTGQPTGSFLSPRRTTLSTWCLMHKLKVVDGSGHTGIAAHILIDHAGADGLAALVVLPQARGAMTR